MPESIYTSPTGATTVVVLDQPHPVNGACHRYQVRLTEHGNELGQTIEFQNGPIAENGINGIANEDLLEIVKHRLEGFQRGEFKSEANAQALTGVQLALYHLNARTADRVERDVEGQNIA